LLEQDTGFIENILKLCAVEDLHPESAARSECMLSDSENRPAEVRRTEVVTVACSIGRKIREYGIELSAGKIFEVLRIEVVDISGDRKELAAEFELDRFDVYADDRARVSDKFCFDLHPGARSAAEIKHSPGAWYEVKPVIELLELVCRSGEIAVFFGLLEVLILCDSSCHGWMVCAKLGGVCEDVAGIEKPPTRVVPGAVSSSNMPRN
jgi:hypothetical protein